MKRRWFCIMAINILLVLTILAIPIQVIGQTYTVVGTTTGIVGVPTAAENYSIEEALSAPAIGPAESANFLVEAGSPEIYSLEAPEVTIISPAANNAIQDGVTFQAQATDESGVEKLFFSIREPNGEEGIPIVYEDLEATYNSTSGYWEYWFDTTKLQDGYYVIFAKAIDTMGNEGMSSVVPFSIRNWAVITQLPSTPNSKAGRTMPVKFSLRIAASVDPNQPFVYNEDLEIRIYDAKAPGTILQRSVFGTGSKDYRIDITAQLYQTNFQTGKTPATYVVEIWRPSKNFLVGSFTFKTVK
jgi:hypothetical protein